METISQEEFKKRYGTQGVIKVSQPIKKPTMGEIIGKAFKGGIEQVKEGVQQVGKGGTNPLSAAGNLIEGVGKVGSGAIGAAFSPLAPAIEPTIGKAVSYAGEQISKIPAVQKFAESKVGQGVARTAENVVNYANIAGTVGGAMEIPKIGSMAKTGLNKVKTGIGEVIDTTRQGIQEIKNVTKNVLEGKDAKILSIFTGEKDAVIQSALKNPKLADIGIQGGDVALREAVQKGGQASLKAMNDFTSAYNAAFSKLTAFSRGKLIGSKKILYQFADDLKSAGVKFKDGKLDFDTSLIKANPGEVSKIQAAYDAIRGWKDWSLKGTNNLKQMIGKLTKFANEAGGTSKSPFLGKFYHYLDTTIKENLPKNISKAYERLNTKFSSTIGLYEEMVKAFNSGDPFKRIAQVFGENSDALRQIIDFYEKTTGNKITPIAAGRALAERKQAAFGFLNPRSWIDFFIDPKTQAKIVTKVGKIKQP